jgi:hypothetical protein
MKQHCTNTSASVVARKKKIFTRKEVSKMENKKRLIDANAFWESVSTDYWEHFTQCHTTDQIVLMEMVKENLAEQPTVDAVEVVHGYWAHLGGDEWCCTACGEVIHTEGSWEKPSKKYCHECCAKMDGDGNA